MDWGVWYASIDFLKVEASFEPAVEELVEREGPKVEELLANGLFVEGAEPKVPKGWGRGTE